MIKHDIVQIAAISENFAERFNAIRDDSTDLSNYNTWFLQAEEVIGNLRVKAVGEQIVRPAAEGRTHTVAVEVFSGETLIQAATFLFQNQSQAEEAIDWICWATEADINCSLEMAKRVIALEARIAALEGKHLRVA